MLNEIITSHPLFGIEKEDTIRGHLSGLKPPLWVLEGPIYEIFVRAFSKEGTFEQVAAKIDYLKDLGIKTIWLMPIHPIGLKGRKGSLGSPYAIHDYYAIDKNYGSKKQFKNLVSKIHDFDMRIIMDFVANHTANDHVLTSQEPDLFLKDSRGEFFRKKEEWSDVIDLDYDNPNTRRTMRDILLYWTEEFDIDGYRCDVAGMVPIDFWQEVYQALKNIKEDIFLLAEWEASRFHLNAFHATYDWSLYVLLEDVCLGKRGANDILKWVKEKQTIYPQFALPLRFTENHDQQRTIVTFGKTSFYPFVALIFSLYGIPLIYAGQEFGADKTPSLYEKDSLPWNETDKDIFNFYKHMIALRKNHPALAAEKLNIIDNEKPDQVVSFQKVNKQERIVCIFNFSGKEQEINNIFESKNYVDLMDPSTKINWGDRKNIDLKPYQILLLQEI
jgi:cyclomaltodextrinase